MENRTPRIDDAERDQMLTDTGALLLSLAARLPTMASQLSRERAALSMNAAATALLLIREHPARPSMEYSQALGLDEITSAVTTTDH